MSRYIDADEAIRIWEEKDYIRLSKQERQAKKMLDELPSADVVKVVRCKDCKFWDSGCRWCDLWGDTQEYDDGYCSYGEMADTEAQEEREIINARKGEE